MKNPYNRGYEAFWTGTGNPYKKGTDGHYDFATGYIDASIDAFKCYIRSAK